eukprot:366113-Chlamydomonas_euryale.AAC.16
MCERPGFSVLGRAKACKQVCNRDLDLCHDRDLDLCHDRDLDLCHDRDRDLCHDRDLDLCHDRERGPYYVILARAASASCSCPRRGSWHPPAAGT